MYYRNLPQTDDAYYEYAYTDQRCYHCDDDNGDFCKNKGRMLPVCHGKTTLISEKIFLSHSPFISIMSSWATSQSTPGSCGFMSQWYSATHGVSIPRTGHIRGDRFLIISYPKQAVFGEGWRRLAQRTQSETVWADRKACEKTMIAIVVPTGIASAWRP